MNEMSQMLIYRQMFGGESWTQAIFLAGVFLILLFRREQIVSPYMFRVSIILFVLSFILPVVMTFVWQLIVQNSGGFLPSLGNYGTVVQTLMAAVGPVSLGLAILLCVLSMLPPQSRYPAPSTPVHPHPLD